VTGIDLSPYAVGRAAEEARGAGVPAEFRPGDMRSPPPGPFDGVCCLGNSISYLSQEDLRAFLRGVQAAPAAAHRRRAPPTPSRPVPRGDGGPAKLRQVIGDDAFHGIEKEIDLQELTADTRVPPAGGCASVTPGIGATAAGARRS
jgi:Methyltransferase domain